MLLLLRRRQASISEFKGRYYVDVREYYDKVGGGAGMAVCTCLLRLKAHTRWHKTRAAAGCCMC
jgi:hypothetical protein